VFQCYLDDSGTSGLPLVTMAGFIAPLAQWEQLEPVWSEILNRYGVEVFHAKEFHDTKGCFEGWTKIKKRTFTEEVFSAAHGRMQGLAVAARKREFEAEKRETGLVQDMSAYGVCFSTIVLRVVLEPQIGREVMRRGVSFLVEGGNKNNSELENWFDHMSKQRSFRGCLQEMTLVPKASCRAIQMADFFAFYIRRYLRDHDRFSGTLQLPMNAYLMIMQKHFPIWHWIATGFLKREIGQMDDLPSFDDMSFWGPGGTVRKL
jgi:uncharacterized protein DUF3800